MTTVDFGDDDPRRTSELRLARRVHLLFLPWWFICWFFVGSAAMHVAFLIAVVGIGAGLWIVLFNSLARWSLEGRDVTWELPVRWAGMSILTVAFAMAYLIPRLRTWLELEPKRNFIRA